MKNNAQCAPVLPKAGFSFTYGDRAIHGTASMQVDAHLNVTVEAAEYPEFSATEWVLWFENPSSERSAVLSDIRDGDFTVPLPPAPEKFKGDISLPGERSVISMNGCVPGIDYSTDDASSATEFAAAAHYFHPMRGKPGSVSFAFTNNCARSSENQAPFFEVTQGGQGAIVAIGWTGGWRAKFTDASDGVRVEAGLAKARFYLEPGEKLRTSRILVMHYSQGEDASNKFRRLVRKHFSHVASRPSVREGLLAYELWGGLTSEEMIRRVKTLKAKGLAYEDLWIDAGWYGDSKKCDDAYTGDWWSWTGDWTPNKRVHPDGLADVATAAKDAGMGMMLWFEPERVVGSSNFAKEHPDLLSGALLYYGNEKGRVHMRETISHYARRLGFSCYRQDFNYDPAGDLAKLDPPDREGIAEIRHITGLYRLWDELLDRFPKMLIDNCASGGRRIDIETLRRSVAFFRSDYQCGFNLNPEVLQAHNAGISRLLPYNGCTVKLSDVYALRSAYSASHGVAYWNAIFQDEKAVDWAAAKKCCDEYRRIRRFFPCDFYNHGSATLDPTAWAIWQYHDPEAGEGVVLAFRRAESPSSRASVALKGLPSGAKIDVENLDSGEKATVSADALEISLPERRTSTVLIYRCQ
jgi:alpha-galactosidase